MLCCVCLPKQQTSMPSACSHAASGSHTHTYLPTTTSSHARAHTDRDPPARLPPQLGGCTQTMWGRRLPSPICPHSLTHPPAPTQVWPLVRQLGPLLSWDEARDNVGPALEMWASALRALPVGGAQQLQAAPVWLGLKAVLQMMQVSAPAACACAAACTRVLFGSCSPLHGRRCCRWCRLVRLPALPLCSKWCRPWCFLHASLRLGAC